MGGVWPGALGEGGVGRQAGHWAAMWGLGRAVEVAFKKP